MATPDRGLWSQPVPIAMRKSGVTLLVGNSRRAAELLTDDWPKAGPKHRAACKAVLAAMEKALDKERQAKARAAFREAAIEAGIARDLGGEDR
jgi:hypothetical protein